MIGRNAPFLVVLFLISAHTHINGEEERQATYFSLWKNMKYVTPVIRGMTNEKKMLDGEQVVTLLDKVRAKLEERFGKDEYVPEEILLKFIDGVPAYRVVTFRANIKSMEKMRIICDALFTETEQLLSQGKSTNLILGTYRNS